VLNTFPELNGLTTEQLPVAIQIMQKTNPQRAALAASAINQARALAGRHLEAAARQEQQAQEQQRAHFTNWAASEDAAFDDQMNKAGVSREQRAELRAETMKMFESAGLSKAEITELWNTNPLMRGRVGQQIMADAARYRMGVERAKSALAAPLPPVQRPGMGGSPSADADLRALDAGLSRATSVNDQLKLAAEMLRIERYGRG
jgi:hypothetical protein